MTDHRLNFSDNLYIGNLYTAADSSYVVYAKRQ
jgi:hypothetical protein